MFNFKEVVMVIKQKNNGKWEYCVYLGLDERGKKKYKRKSGFVTKKACVREATKIQNGENIRSYKTFEDICKLYLKDYELRFLRDTTLQLYKSRIEFIKKNFPYDKDVNKIDIQDINNFIIRCKTTTRGHYTRHMVALLKTILKFAISNDYMRGEILNKIHLPPMYKGERRIWSKSDVVKYLPMLAKFKYFDIIMIILETGLRRGEVCALTWDCVDLANRTIKINKSYVSFLGLNTITSPKTNSSNRTIILLDHSLEILKNRSKNRKSKYVFCDKYKNPIKPNILYASFRRFLLRHNIKYITVHDLRHIHATLLLNSNIDYKMLSKRLGHTNVAFTLQTYTHVLPEHEFNTYKELGDIMLK